MFSAQAEPEDLYQRLGRKPVVLCVDDSPEVLRSLERTFRGEPYDVWTTDEPTEALEWVRQGEVDVLIADQRMPGIKGTELLKAAEDVSPRTAQVLLTAYPGDPLVVHSLRRTPLVMIGKPWNDEALRRTVADLLEKR